MAKKRTKGSASTRRPSRPKRAQKRQRPAAPARVSPASPLGSTGGLEAYAQAIVDTVAALILVLDSQLRVRQVNRAFCETFELSREEIEGKLVAEIGHGEWKTQPFLDAAREVASGARTTARLELSFETGSLGTRTFTIGAHLLLGPPAPCQVLCTIEDITERRRAESAVGELSGRLLNLRDEEQRRIARELHDSTAQNASALAMNLALVLEADGLTDQSRRVLTDSRVLAEQTARELRDLASLLHPPFLDEVGLLQAIRHHVVSFERRTGIDVEVALPDEDPRLPKEVEMAAFRIIQESLANVQRHAESPNAHLALELDNGHLRVSVRDRGRGFDPNCDRRDRPRGLGIDGMKERAKQLGGKLELRSGKGGTTVEARIPVQRDGS